MTATQTVSTRDRAVWSKGPSGPVYSFVPAGDAPRSQTLVAELMEAMRSHLSSEADARTVLLADFSGDADTHVEPQPLTITCANLAGAGENLAAFLLRISEAIFVVTTADEASMQEARRKAAWLRSIQRDENAGLVLLPAPGGLSMVEAEDATGLPVCAVIRDATQIRQLAAWITQD